MLKISKSYRHVATGHETYGCHYSQGTKFESHFVLRDFFATFE